MRNARFFLKYQVSKYRVREELTVREKGLSGFFVRQAVRPGACEEVIRRSSRVGSASSLILEVLTDFIELR